MRKAIAAILGAAMMMVTSIAMATPINGYIDFTGTQQLSKTGGGTPTFMTADKITFTNPASVLVTEGDFTAIADGTPVTLTSFIFDPNTVTSNPLIPLWTLTTAAGTYSFDLTSLVVRRSSQMLELSGLGVIHAPNFDDTPGAWDLTTQSSNGAIRGRLSFSTDTAPVPEPGTMMLLGAGFLGLAIYGKRRKNA
jgi:hypothetical protein